MNKLKDLQAFLKENRLIIYVLLGSILMLQICSKGSKRISLPEGDEVISEIENPLPADDYHPENGQNNLGLNRILLLLGLTLLLFVAKRKGWLNKIYPKIFIFRVVYFKKKSNGELVLKVFILNRTRKSVTIEAPSLVFFKGKYKRQFVIKNMGGQQLFPLVLSPDTGHKFIISAQKFYNNVEGLKAYKVIRMSLPTQNGKTYTSTKWPVIFTWRRL